MNLDRVQARVEEGVTLDGHTVETIAYLQQVFDAMEAGTAESLYADPFAASVISDERVEAVIAAIDAEFTTEITQAPGYHRNRSGATHTPEFSRLPQVTKRAVVEELQRICDRHPRNEGA